MSEALPERGFATVEQVYDEHEIATLCQLINRSGIEKAFGVREFLLRVPEIVPILFNESLRQILHRLLPGGAQVIRSLYFDKPPHANWIVNWHQDLTINLTHREDHPGFQNWRRVRGGSVVQPPVELLQRIVTVRIHLDDCTVENGALRVIPGSHRHGVIDMRKWSPEDDDIFVCEVPAGGIMLMKPLLLHSSRRSTAGANRRVIHLECCAETLPGTLQWKEATWIPPASTSFPIDA